MKISKQSVDYVQNCGSDLSVVNAARVSFHKESDWDRSKEESFQKDGIPYTLKLTERDVKLITYLATHGHISPFHHAFITLRVKAPVFVARQLVKHKFMPWNEVSRRYVDEEPEFYWPSHWRKQAENVKQGSGGFISSQYQPWCYSVSETAAIEALRTYNGLLQEGVAPEQARMVLPQNTMTEWMWSGTLSAWASMLNLRLKPDTQQETREVAQMCYNIIEPLFPVSMKALVHV